MKAALFLILTTISMPSLADNYQVEIDHFFMQVRAGEIDEAVDRIYKSNPYVSAVPDQINNLKRQLSALPDLLGDLHEIYKMDTFAVDDTLTHITYMATYDRQPVRFEFQYFKLGDDWRIYSFSFDDEVFSRVQELARERAFLKE